MKQTPAISISTLALFIDVFDAQSFSVVARKEGVSASKVSRLIKQLEDTLGQQLFYRNTRAVIPTEAGRVFMDYARSITEQMDSAQKALQARIQTPTGLLRINAPVFFGQRHIAPWLPEFCNRYPELEIDLTLTDDFVDPHHYATDVIFRIGRLHDSGLHARVFAEQTYHLAAAPEYVARYGDIDNLQALAQHYCLLYKGNSGPNRWLFKTDEHSWQSYTMPARMISNNAESLLTAALQGMGIVLFPDWLLGDYLKSGALIKLLPQYQATVNTDSQQIAAIYPNTRHLSLNVRVLIDYFSKVYSSPPYWQYS